MKVDDLYLVNKNKVIPFYYLDIGKEFRISSGVSLTHLCPYTKITNRVMRCDHSAGTVPDEKLLVKPV